MPLSAKADIRGKGKLDEKADAFDVRLIPNIRLSIDKKEDFAEPSGSGNLIPSRSQGQFFDEFVRDWLAQRKGDARLGSLEPSRRNVVSTRLDGGR